MDITIRPYQQSDHAAVASLVLGIQNGEFNVNVTLNDQADLKDVSSFFQVDRGNFWVAVDNDAIVGTIGAKDIGDGRIALRKMFVAKEYRGKARGVAKQLLVVLLEWARVHAFHEVLLGTIHILEAAQRFYEQNGFTLVAPDDLPPSFPRMAVDDRFYRYQLSSR